MARRLIWTNDAQLDRREIFKYWNKRNNSTSYSKKLNRHFRKELLILKDSPKIGRQTKQKDIRIKLIKDYWFIYKITSVDIQILRIWDVRRNPDDFELLLNQTRI